MPRCMAYKRSQEHIPPPLMCSWQSIYRLMGKNWQALILAKMLFFNLADFKFGDQYIIILVSREV